MEGFIRHGSSTDQVSDSIIAGDFHLTKTGSNILRLQGNTLYTNPSDVLDGVLSVEGTTVSTPYNVKNTSRISAWDKVTDLGPALNFTDDGGIKLFPVGGTLNGNLLVTDVTQANTILVDIAGPTDEKTHLILLTRNSLDPIMTIGQNLSGHNARVEVYGVWTFVTTGWGTLFDIYNCGRQNINYQIQSPMTGTVGITYGVQSGAMPPGLTMSTAGVITGTTPEVASDQTFTFMVRVFIGATVLTHTYTWKVLAPIYDTLNNNTRWYAPPTYSPTMNFELMVVGGGGGASSSNYAHGGNGGQVVFANATAPSGHYTDPVIGGGGAVGGAGGDTTFRTVVATGGVAKSGGGGASGGARGGLSNGQTGNNSGISGQAGVLCGQSDAAVAARFGIAVGTTRLGAGGGGGTFFGSAGGAGYYGGGRGTKSTNNTMTAGVANTGGGGGGRGGYQTSKKGGSGVVFVKY